jgi:hypothetical protein
MRIKGSCDCRFEDVGSEQFNGYLFKVIQIANKYQQSRTIVVKNGVITDINTKLVTDERVIAHIKPGTTIAEIELLYRPF